MRGSNWHLWKTMISGLVRVQSFCRMFLLTVQMLDLLFGMLLPLAPLLQCYLHHQRLSIADIIILFCRRRHRGGASAPSWSVGKGQLPPLIWRINFKYKLELCARHLEDEYRGEPQSEDMKSLIHCRGRLEGGLSGCQGCAGGCQTTVVDHEMAIKEVWELLLEVRDWPRGDRGNLCWIHLNPVYWHNETPRKRLMMYETYFSALTKSDFHYRRHKPGCERYLPFGSQ